MEIIKAGLRMSFRFKRHGPRTFKKQGAEQVTHFCRLLHSPLPESISQDERLSMKPLSDSQKLRKVIMELIETERHYVKDLNCLIERYLEPLKEETFLSGEDTEQLFGNIQEIVQFQKLFLQSLEEAVELEPGLSMLSEPKQYRDEDLRRILFSLGGSFLYYANHFKLYSSFCASHSKAQKVLNPENNMPLQEFLRARNPKQQHSATLESYLIKPIQRILKYPLLLQQLKHLTDPASDEHHHLAEALRGMEAVAGHINEMQKIYEEYGQVFDDLIKQYKDMNPQFKPIDLNVGELQMYGNVNWLNAAGGIGKMKKGTELVTILFVFKTGIVLLVQERNKTKKKQKPPQGKLVTGTDSSDQVRYQTVIPVDQLQVRSNNTRDTERHGLWELVHCKSETEGRPERVFQLASSLDAKNEFLKTIRNTIRESVRRMSLPVGKPSAKTKQQYFAQSLGNGGNGKNGGCERPSYLPNQHPRSISQKKGKILKGDLTRHSMEIEDHFNAFEPNEHHMRTRSRTFSDLNDMDNPDNNPGPYATGSQTTLSSESGRSGSAKLLHASNNPVNYSNTNLHRESMNSPIWKPRHATKRVHVRSPLTGETTGRTLESTVYGNSIYGGDYQASSQPSALRYDDRHSALMLTPPNTYLEHDDTEC